MIIFEEGEYVIHIARKHWFVFAIHLLPLFILAFFPIILLAVLGFVPEESRESAFALYTFCYLIYLFFIWITMFLIWTDYYLDIAIVTNKRIMEIEQKGLFRREVSSMRYEKIQDITSEIEGVIPTLLDYGDLYVQTAATTRDFSLDRIASPGLVKEMISKEMSKKMRSLDKDLSN